MKTIGIVCLEQDIDKNGYKQKVNIVANSYIDILVKNNAIPILLSPQISKNEVVDIVKKIDGMMFIGGEDIKEGYYNSDLNVRKFPKEMN